MLNFDWGSLVAAADILLVSSSFRSLSGYSLSKLSIKDTSCWLSLWYGLVSVMPIIGGERSNSAGPFGSWAKH